MAIFEQQSLLDLAYIAYPVQVACIANTGGSGLGVELFIEQAKSLWSRKRAQGSAVARAVDVTTGHANRPITATENDQYRMGAF